MNTNEQEETNKQMSKYVVIVN